MVKYNNKVVILSEQLGVRPSTIVKYLNGELSKFQQNKIIALLNEKNISIDKSILTSESEDQKYNVNNINFSLWKVDSNTYRLQLETDKYSQSEYNKFFNSFLSDLKEYNPSSVGVISSFKNNKLRGNIIKLESESNEKHIIKSITNILSKYINFSAEN